VSVKRALCKTGVGEDFGVEDFGRAVATPANAAIAS